MPHNENSDHKKVAHEEQAERFRDAARALGADEDEAAFKAKLAVIAKQKPPAAAKRKEKS